MGKVIAVLFVISLLVLSVGFVSAGFIDNLFGKKTITGYVGSDVESENLLSNGDFSNGLDSWKKGGSGNVSVINSAYDILSIQGYGFVYQSFSSSPGKKYRVSLDSMGTGGSAPNYDLPSIYPYVHIQRVDSNGWSSIITKKIEKNVWNDDYGKGIHTFEFTIEDSANYHLVLATSNEDAGNSEYAFFDNVVLEDISVVSENYCVDSDGGLNYAVKGYVNTSVSSGTYFEDYCLSNALLIERHCLDNISPNNFSVEYNCSSLGMVCSDGACANKSNIVNQQNEIIISSPNGGEKYIQGTQVSIRWKNENNSENDKVKIYLYKDNQNYRVINEDVSNNGFYSWAIDDDVQISDNYSIKVVSYRNSSVFDQSDSTFSILKNGSIINPESIEFISDSVVGMDSNLEWRISRKPNFMYFFFFEIKESGEYSNYSVYPLTYDSSSIDFMGDDSYSISIKELIESQGDGDLSLVNGNYRVTLRAISFEFDVISNPIEFEYISDSPEKSRSIGTRILDFFSNLFKR
jgi:hypothetical protein